MKTRTPTFLWIGQGYNISKLGVIDVDVPQICGANCRHVCDSSRIDWIKAHPSTVVSLRVKGALVMLKRMGWTMIEGEVGDYDSASMFVEALLPASVFTTDKGSLLPPSG